MNHKPWTMTAKAGGELEVLIYEQIGTDFWTGDGITAKQFATDLKAAGAVAHIHLKVSSPGGSVFEGLAMYNALLSHGAKVTAQVDGLAASIASVIIMAASEISVAANGMVMIHNPSTVVGGDSNEMRKMAETMDKVKTSMVTAYKRHTTLSTDKINALMDDETWMTAEEAIEKGFAEKITTPEDDDADVVANFDLSKFRKVPQPIVAKFGSRSRPDPRSRPDRRRFALARQRHEDSLHESRRHTMAMHQLELDNMRVVEAVVPEEERRRRVAQTRDRELAEMGVAGFAWEDKYVGGIRVRQRVEIDRNGERRFILAQRDRELGRRQVPVFDVRIQT